MTKRIVFLGTGHATVTRYYNTCFFIESEKDALLVDAGGGNGILTRLREARLSVSGIHHMFVTHTHMDHILGTAWILRMTAQLSIKGEYEGKLYVYGHKEVIYAIKCMAELLLSQKHKRVVEKRVVYREMENGGQEEFADFRFTAVDAESTKCRQFGILLDFADGKRWFYPGDEPYRRMKAFPEERVRGADVLIHEAFCLYGQRAFYDPYGKHHSTVKEAAACARHLEAGTLILVHTEEDTAAEKKRLYEEEAKGEFSGRVIVPGELEELVFDKEEG